MALVVVPLMPMLDKSTVQLLRIPFSLFLMPVYFFAVSQVPDLHLIHAVAIFVILHLLVYPSSNGFNAYMDNDSGPIGGVEKPLPPTRELLVVSAIMDLVALVAGLMISAVFACGLLLYILASRAYSARSIRIKKYPVAGYILVVICQGALTWMLVYHGASMSKPTNFPILPVIAASLLIGGFYPLTQVYQHEQDRRDGVTTISMLLGHRGTFVFTALVYSIAMAMLFIYFQKTGSLTNFFLLASIMLPVLVYFFWWAAAVWKDGANADFKRAMKMNLIASVCTNLGFIIILTGRYL